MRVSVIIPTLNDGAFIADALDSVLEQTRPPEEIVVVDGGSSDSTRDIVSDYAETTPDVDVRLLDGGDGIAGDLNTGFSAASGDVLLRLDGDDRYRPQKVERELERMRETGADFVISNHVKINETGTPTEGWTDDTLPEGNLFEDCLTRTFPKNTLFRFPLIRRELLEEAGDYDASLPLFEDWDFKVRLSRYGTAAACQSVHTEYRQHSESITSQPNWEERADAVHTIYAKNRDLLNRSSVDHRVELSEQFSELFLRYESLGRGGSRGKLRTLQRYLAYLLVRPHEVKNIHLHRQFVRNLIQ